MYCPTCGQRLPENGVCYNCVKNKTDAKRFGKGTGTLPAYVKYGERQSKQVIDQGPKSTRPRRARRSTEAESQIGKRTSKSVKTSAARSAERRSASRNKSRKTDTDTPLYLGREGYWKKHGKRPKRKKNTVPAKTEPRKCAPSSGRVVKRIRPIETKIRNQRTLADVIEGGWHNLQTGEIVRIECKGSRWLLTKATSKPAPQQWEMLPLSTTRLSFIGRKVRIVASVNDIGCLILQEGERRVPFAALADGRKHRVCNRCLGLSGWLARRCINCAHIFG